MNSEEEDEYEADIEENDKKDAPGSFFLFSRDEPHCGLYVYIYLSLYIY